MDPKQRQTDRGTKRQTGAWRVPAKWSNCINCGAAQFQAPLNYYEPDRETVRQWDSSVSARLASASTNTTYKYIYMYMSGL